MTVLNDPPPSDQAVVAPETPTAAADAPPKPARRRRAAPAAASADAVVPDAAEGVADAGEGTVVAKAPRRRAAEPVAVAEGAQATEAAVSPAMDAASPGAALPAALAEGPVVPVPRSPTAEAAAAVVADPGGKAVPPIVSEASPLGVFTVASLPSQTEGKGTGGEDAATDAAAGDPPQGDANASDRSRRRNRRERQRAQRAAEAAAGGGPTQPASTGGAAGVQQAVPEQAGAVFAQVLSGEFDVADAPDGTQPDAASTGAPPADADAPDAAAPKRVLAPEADAPKLQKVLAQAGVGSRRDMEDLILEGAITVNGEPAHIGQRISFGDRIVVSGKPVKYRIAPPAPRLLAYHKPAGEIVTHDDPQQRPTVFRRLPRLQQGRWLSVGRLDINTEGLLLFTNSGELANQLMHPRFGVEREYAVRVLGTLEPEAKARLLAGVEVEGQTAAFKSIEDGGGDGANHWWRVVITEGRNREVRKLFDAVGLTVSRLIRIRYGTVVLPRGLRRGVWVDLAPDDVRRIRQLAGNVPRGDAPRPGQGGEVQEGRGRGQGQGQRDERGPRPASNAPRNGPGPRPDVPRQAARPPDAEPRRDRAPADTPRDGDEDLDFDPSRIPNPLEQTFDRRFATNPRSPVGGGGFARGGGGFGRGGSAPEPYRGGTANEPDPLQTSLGYIGGDAFHRKANRGNFRKEPGGHGNPYGGTQGTGFGGAPKQGGFGGNDKGGKGPNRGGHGGNRGR